MSAANKSRIKTYGERDITLNFRGHTFQWRFTIADVGQPLIGADFLRAKNLLVVIKGQRLVDAENYTSIQCCTQLNSPQSLRLIVNDSSPIRKVLKEYSDVFAPYFLHKETKHGVTHTIATVRPPISSKARRLPSKNSTITRAEFSQMEKNGNNQAIKK